MVSLIPRPVKLSATKVANPALFSSPTHMPELKPTPPEPCTRTTAGSRSVPGFGMRSSPAIIAGLPSFLPSRKSAVLSVTVCTGKISVRKTACARASSKMKTEPAIVNEQIRAWVNEAFMDSLPCHSTFADDQRGVNDCGRFLKMWLLLIVRTFGDRRHRLLPLIRRHQHTSRSGRLYRRTRPYNNCVRSQALEFGRIVSCGVTSAHFPKFVLHLRTHF